MPTSIDLPSLLPALLDAAQDASARIMADWGHPKTVSHKIDGSPVTQTDADAEKIITVRLRALMPAAIVAEEEFEDGVTPTIDPDAPFFLIDALDGTRDFIKDGRDFTVNIALIVNRQPVAGVILAPALGVTWYATQGYGAHRIEDGITRSITMRDIPKDGLFLLGGKRSSEPVVLEPFIGPQIVADRAQRSSSLKFCLLAEAAADVYPRLGETYEWDTAAGDIIMREAGGAVIDLATGKPLAYGKQERRFLNGGFIAGHRGLFLSLG